MGGILLGSFELPLTSQEDDELPLYDSSEGELPSGIRKVKQTSVFFLSYIVYVSV